MDMGNPVALSLPTASYIHLFDFYLLGVKKCLDVASECGCRHFCKPQKPRVSRDRVQRPQFIGEDPLHALVAFTTRANPRHVASPKTMRCSLDRRRQEPLMMALVILIGPSRTTRISPPRPPQRTGHLPDI